VSSFSVTVTGQDVLKARLQGLVDALAVDQILDEMEALLLSRIRARFLQQVDPNGVPWVPSHASLRRAAQGIGGGTLFNTGRLFHSIQAFKEDENTRAIGTNVEYAEKLQIGEPPPARVFLGFGEEDSVLATALVQKRIDQAMT
jgi:phage gpG-like protein